MAVRKQAKEESFTGKENAYEAAMKEGRDHLERQKTGVIVVKSEDRPWQQARQGKLKYHLIPSLYKDTVLQSWRVFSHEITTQSANTATREVLFTFWKERDIPSPTARS